ncbi:hypothetical protein DMUE_3174 [Dictyocoela muelleri]|nr:hypothetical protein DMUE_3174 [Dictyocoela muelleri]
MSGNQERKLNKIHSTKSIYLDFFLQKSTYDVDRNILNSRRDLKRLMNRIQEEIESIRTNIFTYDKIEQDSFKYRNEMTGLEKIHKINLLKSFKNKKCYHGLTYLKKYHVYVTG